MAALVKRGRSSSWMRMRAERSLALFREAAKRVPAYRAFLKEHGVRPASIHTFDDLSRVPPTSKAGYLKNYPLADLCWDGALARPAVFSSTSGSTGKPFYFQRTENLEEQYSVLAELFLGNGARLPDAKHPTLVIIGFGMGVWIGGTLTFRAFDIASRRAHPVSILPAGVNKSEILHALRDLAPSFSQTVLIGYPPFVKDILDEAAQEGIDLKKLDLRLMFAAESFTEQFRDYLAEKTGIHNVFRDTLNIYGTADIGAMAFETPAAILVRRLALKNKELYQALFGQTEKLPTLAQYNPAYVSFEAQEGEILLTGTSAMPLIRYAVGDQGGALSFDEVLRICRESGVDLRAEAKRADVPLYELPFVYVYARSDMSTKLYGAIVYPEHVREALEERALQKSVTGKFAMRTVADKKHDQSLEVNVELRSGVKASPRLRAEIGKRVLARLLEKNAEYRNNHSAFPERVTPAIVLWPQGDPKYFTSGIKQKWVIKEPAPKSR
jgi:phenylacetate-CoA ligase